MFAKLKIGTEINLMLRAVDGHAGLKPSEIEKELKRFLPEYAWKMKTEGWTPRQAAIALVTDMAAQFDLEKLEELAGREPMNYFGLACLVHVCANVRDAQPNEYKTVFRELPEGVEQTLRSSFR
jgi:hypothetical protein